MGTGPNARGAISGGVHANNTHTIVATNNVIRGLTSAFGFSAQDAADPNDPGGTLVMTLTNNTIKGATESAVQPRPGRTTYLLGVYTQSIASSHSS